MAQEFGRAEADAVCPVSLDQLGVLTRAEAPDVIEAVRDFPEEKRVRLALFCYNRSHLRALALTIASTVEPERLVDLAGTMGGVLAAQSRAKGLSFGTQPLPSDKKPEKPKSKISLGGRS